MGMAENPYEAPRSLNRVVGIRSGKLSDLYSVALYQKAIMFCVLGYIAVSVLMVALGAIANEVTPPLVALGLPLVGLGIVVTGVTFTFLLAIKVYNVGVGIVLGFLALIPCIGLLVLLTISSRATAVLRQNGISVGFLGADLSRIGMF